MAIQDGWCPEIASVGALVCWEERGNGNAEVGSQIGHNCENLGASLSLTSQLYTMELQAMKGEKSVTTINHKATFKCEIS